MNPASSVGVWTSLHWSKEFLVKANGTQKVIESFPNLHHSKFQYLLLFLSFCNISFPGKVRWSKSHRQHTRLFPPRYTVCVCGGRVGRERLFSSGLLRSSVTWAGHRPTDTNSLRELTALTGLRSARVWGMRICVWISACLWNTFRGVYVTPGHLILASSPLNLLVCTDVVLGNPGKLGGVWGHCGRDETVAKPAGTDHLEIA